MIMENARGFLLMLSLTIFLQNSTGQVLSDESLFQHHSCYGSNGDYSIVNASCSADTVIAVSTVQAGAKLSNSSCPIAVDENTTVDFEYCCKMKVDDCAVNVSTTIWHALCSGNESCLATQAVSVPSNCTSMFRSNTSNMQLDYYCINITRIGSTCTHVTMTTANNSLYLWNTGYSYGVNIDTDCVCSIQVESCDAHIDVTAMRIDLKDDNGTCIQNITFSDSYGNPEMVIDCWKEYDITSLFRSTTNYLSMNFISARNNTLGKYWIRFKATEAKSNLKVNCNPAEQQIYCTTTSTTTTSSTTTTTTQTTTTATTSTSTSAATRTTIAATTRTTFTTTKKTEERPQEDLRYIAYTALCIPIGIAIFCLFRRKHPVKPRNQPAARTPSVISLSDELKSMPPETDLESEVAPTSIPATPTTSRTTSTEILPTRKETTFPATTTTDTSRLPSPPTSVSDLESEVAPTSIPVTHTTSRTTSTEILPTRKETTFPATTTTDTSRLPSPPTSVSVAPTFIPVTHTTSRTTSTEILPTRRETTFPATTKTDTSRLPSPPTSVSAPSRKPCACSYCGQLGKHYHPISSSSGKYSERKHFRCRYCGIFWDKTTSLPLYSPCQFLSNQY